MPKTVTIMFLVGFIIVITLVVREGIGKVWTALEMAGWNILWVAAYRFVPITIDAVGWYHLIAVRHIPLISKFVLYRWFAESCNTLLPAAQIGGHMVRALMLAQSGVSKTLASASVVVDFTLGLGTQLLFILMGILMLVFKEIEGLNVALLAAGISAGFLMVGGFVLVQRLGVTNILINIARHVFKDKKLSGWLGSMQRLEQDMGLLYEQYGRLVFSALIRLLGWLARSGETYLALFFLGSHATIVDALILEAMCIAANSVGFLLPGALGVREGGILAIGGLLGLPAETALALALIKRARELLVGLPGLGALLVFQKDLLLPAAGSSKKNL
jgi:putative membrane protein